MSDPSICYCSRCNTPCRVAGPPNPDAKLLRRSAVPSGLCASCATALYLQNSPMARLITKPEMLLVPHLQEHFTLIMQSGNADAQPGEIDWYHVVQNWYLPFQSAKKKKR